jgi:ATP-binding cassette subfamily B (MDR/TAP) protein 1
MFSVIFGAFNVGGAVPHLKSLTEGRLAGRLAYNVIEQVPNVDPNKKGVIIEREKMIGRIEFRNVNFSYPSRPEERVLKDFSCVFE